MADGLLTLVLHAQPIDWSGGHDLQKLSFRRQSYIHALREADKGNFIPLLQFIQAD